MLLGKTQDFLPHWERWWHFHFWQILSLEIKTCRRKPKESKYFKSPSSELECIFPCTLGPMVSIQKYVYLYKEKKKASLKVWPVTIKSNGRILKSMWSCGFWVCCWTCVLSWHLVVQVWFQSGTSCVTEPETTIAFKMIWQFFSNLILPLRSWVCSHSI